MILKSLSKGGYAQMQNKYSSIFSRFLKEPSLPSSVNVSKLNPFKQK